MGEEEVKTLFLSGLPDDVKEREIYNLFRSHAGYESCQLKYSGRGYQIVAFAVFCDQACALAAKQKLHGMKFDPQSGGTLHIELARANSRTKRPRTDVIDEIFNDKKYRSPIAVSNIYTETPSGVGGTMHMHGLVHSVCNDIPGFPPTQSPSNIPSPYAGQDALSNMVSSLMPPPPAAGSNPPCSTLFVANLGSTCTEEELSYMLARFPGFRKIKMQMKGGLPVAFVEFQDVGCSTQALTQLQNSYLPSSDKGGIRLEYPCSVVLTERNRIALVNFLSAYLLDVGLLTS